MNRLEKLFEKKNKQLLNIYFTAGYPNLEDTLPIILELDKAGADLIEIGIPFSDPMADGPTIQQSNQQALDNGMSVNILFDQLKDVRKFTQISLVCMSYLNPILKFGIENFCKKAKAVGIDGIILPDMPLPEYENNYQAVFSKYGINVSLLVSPDTEEKRIAKIDKLTTGFIYLVTGKTVTGSNISHNNTQINTLKRIEKLSLKSPVLAGFGISDAAGYQLVCKYVNGAIIGSEFIRLLSKKSKNRKQQIENFIKNIKA